MPEPLPSAAARLLVKTYLLTLQDTGEQVSAAEYRFDAMCELLAEQGYAHSVVRALSTIEKVITAAGPPPRSEHVSQVVRMSDGYNSILVTDPYLDWIETTAHAVILALPPHSSKVTKVSRSA